MKICPKHIEASVVDASGMFHGKADRYHHYFQILCNACKTTIFRIYISNKKSVKARCGSCGTEVVVYDLALYPAATKLEGDETFAESSLTSEYPTPAYVGYEYGELDEDQAYDQNDITWCQIFVLKKDQLYKIFDDETA